MSFRELLADSWDNLHRHPSLVWVGLLGSFLGGGGGLAVSSYTFGRLSRLGPSLLPLPLAGASPLLGSVGTVRQQPLALQLGVVGLGVILFIFLQVFVTAGVVGTVAQAFRREPPPVVLDFFYNGVRRFGRALAFIVLADVVNTLILLAVLAGAGLLDRLTPFLSLLWLLTAGVLQMSLLFFWVPAAFLEDSGQVVALAKALHVSFTQGKWLHACYFNLPLLPLYLLASLLLGVAFSVTADARLPALLAPARELAPLLVAVDLLFTLPVMGLATAWNLVGAFTAYDRCRAADLFDRRLESFLR